MGRSVSTSAVSEMGSHDGSVHHQPLVGVDTDTEETRIGVDLENLVTDSQVVEDTSPVKGKSELILKTAVNVNILHYTWQIGTN